MLLIFALICIGLFSACSDDEKPTTKTANFEWAAERRCALFPVPKQGAGIYSGGIAKENNVRIKMDYLGSLEIMSMLGDENIDYDAVWPASSIWINMGDVNHKLSTNKPSPYARRLRHSRIESQRVGLGSRRCRDCRHRPSAGQLSFAMTSYTINPAPVPIWLFDGAVRRRRRSAGRIHPSTGFARKDHLCSPASTERRAVHWLVDLFVTSDYDAMVNYEALIIAQTVGWKKRTKNPPRLSEGRNLFANSPRLRQRRGFEG